MKFCPYCGKQTAEIHLVKKLWWCPSCRMIWIVSYSRRLRAAPKKKEKETQ